MVSESRNVYGTEGGTPTVAPSLEANAPLRVEASPAAFGSEVGAATVKKGEAYQGIGQEQQDYAMKAQAMVLETTATNAETGLISSYAKGRADFMSKQGGEATAAMPGYLADLNKQFEDTRSQLPAGAARIFDITGRRLLANYTSEATTYGVAQGKKQFTDSQLSLVNVAKQAAIQNPSDFNLQNGGAAIMNAHQADENTPGITWKEDGPHWDDTPEAAFSQGAIQAEKDKHMGEMINGAVDTVAKDNPLAASALYDRYKDTISPQWQAAISAALAPKIQDAYVSSAITMAKAKWESDYSDTLVRQKPEQAQPGAPSGFANSIFQQETSSGAGTFSNEVRGPKDAVGPMQITPDTWNTWKAKGWVKPGEEITDPAANKAVGMRAADNLLQQYNGDEKRAAVAYFSGEKNVSPAGSDKPYINDYSDGHMLTSDYASQVSGRIATQPYNLPGTPPQNFAKNADGGFLTLADHLATTRYDEINYWRQWARGVKPGDASFENEVASRANGQISQIIEDQKNQYHQDLVKVQEGVTGQLTKGQIPKTIEELRGIPEVAAIMDQLPTRDKESQEYWKNLPENIARYQKRNDQDFSTGGFNAAVRTLSLDPANGLNNQFQLDKLIGSTAPDAINGKDYDVLTKVINTKFVGPAVKSQVLQHMQDIQTFAGNIDGQGGKRAMQYLDGVIKAQEPVDGKRPSDDAIKSKMEDLLRTFQYPRYNQVKNLRQDIEQNKVPVFNSPDDPGLKNFKGMYRDGDGNVRSVQ